MTSQPCNCKTPGQDDGSNTCWQHHDCFLGDCTHWDISETEEPVNEFEEEE